MNPAIAAMLQRYERRSIDDHVNALREILQEIALCGLWRGKFFERAAFYGGTALRVLYGLDRFSEDMDFSLLTPDDGLDLTSYCTSVEQELLAWGFGAEVRPRTKTARTAIESAFLKANTRQLLLVIEAGEAASQIHGRRQLKIRFEVDTEPPQGFATEAKFLLQPIPFSIRAFDQPSLFAGKMHAVLCRGWKSRVKGRDWYDLFWYVARGTPLSLAHLDQRMRQSGHLSSDAPLDAQTFRRMLAERIEQLDVAAARSEVERFLVDRTTVQVWSREFFASVAERVAIQ